MNRNELGLLSVKTVKMIVLINIFAWSSSLSWQSGMNYIFKKSLLVQYWYTKHCENTIRYRQKDLVSVRFNVTLKSVSQVYFRHLPSFFSNFENTTMAQTPNFLRYLVYIYLNRGSYNNLHIWLSTFSCLKISINVDQLKCLKCILSQILLAFWDKTLLKNLYWYFSTKSNSNDNQPDGSKYYAVCPCKSFQGWRSMSKAVEDILVNRLST